MSEMSCFMYLDFEQVLPHEDASRPVRRRWVVTVVTQDQDDVLSRHQLAAPRCKIKISLHEDLDTELQAPAPRCLAPQRITHRRRAFTV